MAAPADLERARLVQDALLGRLVPDLVHQLCNPLNAILTGAVLLQDQGDSEAVREKLLPVLVRSAERMRTLLSGLADVPLCVAGTTQDLRELVDSALAVMSSRKHIVTVHPPASGGPVAVEGEGALVWTLLLFVLEESLRAAQSNLWLSLETTPEHVALTFTHDGAEHGAPLCASGAEENFATDTVAQLGGDLAYGQSPGSGLRTILRFKKPQERN